MIPVCEPLLGQQEEAYLLDCVRSGWISSEGPYVKRFEAAVADSVSVAHGIAVCNGTAALEAALYAAGVGPGDDVIMPTFTIISCALAAIRLGAIPVFVDVDKDTWNMTAGGVEASVTDRTRAIVAVHTYGHPVDMDPILALAKARNLMVVEDPAEAHGAEYKGKRCGSLGHVAALSFYANKLVTTGEGGMVLTNDDAMAARARSYRNLCFNQDERFLHDDLGYNFRMTSLQAAVGLAQVERLEQTIRLKRAIRELYRRHLSSIDGLKLQEEQPWAKSVYWMYAVQMDPRLGLKASEAMAALRERGIGTRPFFRGLHDQPALQSRGFGRSTASCPVADAAYRYGFYLPSSLTLSESQVGHICDAVRSVVEERRLG